MILTLQTVIESILRGPALLEQNMHLFVISCCFILKHLIYFARASLTTIMWINHGLQYGEHMRYL